MTHKRIDTDIRQDKQGFTLLELITVIIIISVFTSLVTPNMSLIIERAKMQEGIQVLHYLRRQQQSYKEMTGSYAGGGIPATKTPGLIFEYEPLQYFEIPEVNSENPPEDPGVLMIGNIFRKAGAPYQYHLHVEDSGTINCAPEPENPYFCANVGLKNTYY